VRQSKSIPLRRLAYGNLGHVYTEMGQFNEAITMLQRGIALQSEKAVFRYNLGNVYLKLNRIAESIEQLEQTIKLKPDYFHAYNDLANAYAELHRYAGAVDALKHAITLNPDSSLAHHTLGAVYYEARRFKKAAASLKSAVSLDPTSCDAYSDLGIAYFEFARVQIGPDRFRKGSEGGSDKRSRAIPPWHGLPRLEDERQILAAACSGQDARTGSGAHSSGCPHSRPTFDSK
jgi:tetratricopeptide (TPR) repeat protein